MVSKSKSNTPNPSNINHPANNLIIGIEDQINSLIKLQPVTLPNDNILEDNPIIKERTSYRYLYVVNWLYNCRGFIKLQSEHFDIDLFEIELLNLVNPPPIDESVLFINKLKISLISTLQNSRLSTINNFEKIFRLWFGLDTPLKGNEDDNDLTPEPTFDNLRIDEKFEILYILIKYISQYPQFRNWIDKNNVSLDVLRINSIYTEDPSKGVTEDYFLLFDNSRLYKRIIAYPILQIPKKRKLAPEDPETFFKDEQFDISEVRFELVCKNIYEYNNYLIELNKKKKLKKNKSIYAKLINSKVLDSIFQNEIKKRKILTNRRKELQLANLLATRKRSSRLEAKEKSRQEELKLLKLQEEEELKIAAEKRLERRRMIKEQHLQPGNHFSNGLSREERLKLRKINVTSATPEAEPLQPKDIEALNQATAEPAELSNQPIQIEEAGPNTPENYTDQPKNEDVPTSSIKPEQPVSHKQETKPNLENSLN